MILVRGMLASCITLLLTSGILVYYFAVSLHAQVEDKLARVASGHRRLIDQFLAERAAELRFTAATHRLEEISEHVRLAALFEELQGASRAFLDLGVFDEKGTHLAYVGPYDLEGKDYTGTDWFEAVRERGLYISDVFSGYREIPHFVIAVRREQDGRRWYLRATIDTLFFNELVESVRIGEEGEAYLVNREGLFQSDRRSGGNLMQPDPDFASYLADSHRIRSFSAGPSWRQQHLYATGVLKQTGWILVVRQGVGDAYGPLGRAVAIAALVDLPRGAPWPSSSLFLWPRGSPAG